MSALNIETLVSHYLVTGVDRQGRRFRIKTTNRLYWQGINVWRGSKWIVDPNGKRHLWQRIYN